MTRPLSIQFLDYRPGNGYGGRFPWLALVILSDVYLENHTGPKLQRNLVIVRTRAEFLALACASSADFANNVIAVHNSGPEGIVPGKHRNHSRRHAMAVGHF